MPGPVENPPPKTIRALCLPNRKQAGKFAGSSEGETPDPAKRPHFLSECGVTAVLYDRNDAPINPLANWGVFYAGFDLARAVKILLFERKADVVVAIFENTALFLLLFRRIFRFRPKMVLLEISPRGWWIRDRVLDFVVPRADYIIALTTNSSDYVQRYYRPRCPVRVLSAGVNELFYAPLEREREFDIVSVGDDGSRDFPTLLEAIRTMSCSLVLKTGRLVSVPPEMNDRVKVINGRISYARLRELYAMARIVCVPLIPSDNPGGISTLLEAMAMGKPLVVSDHGTTRDHLTDGVEGLVVPPRDAVAMREAFQRLLGNPALAAELGVRARARVMRDFAMPVRARKLAALLREAAGAAP